MDCNRFSIVVDFGGCLFDFPRFRNAIATVELFPWYSNTNKRFGVVTAHILFHQLVIIELIKKRSTMLIQPVGSAFMLKGLDGVLNESTLSCWVPHGNQSINDLVDWPRELTYEQRMSADNSFLDKPVDKFPTNHEVQKAYFPNRNKAVAANMFVEVDNNMTGQTYITDTGTVIHDQLQWTRRNGFRSDEWHLAKFGAKICDIIMNPEMSYDQVIAGAGSRVYFGRAIEDGAEGHFDGRKCRGIYANIHKDTLHNARNNRMMHVDAATGLDVYVEHKIGTYGQRVVEDDPDSPVLWHPLVELEVRVTGLQYMTVTAEHMDAVFNQCFTKEWHDDFIQNHQIENPGELIHGVVNAVGAFHH